jgi:PAS domain S-box-containing protein
LKGIFRFHTFPVFGETGELIGVVELAREITGEKRLEIEKDVINNVNKILASSLDVNQVIRAVHIELKRLLDCERMGVALFDGEGKGFQILLLSKEFEFARLVPGIVYPQEGTRFGTVAETGLPVIVADTGASDCWTDQELLKEGIRSCLLFPLEYKGKIIGTMNFGSRKANHFSEASFGLLEQIASGVAISIQNALLFEETKKRLDELIILYEIMKISASSLSLDQMLKEMIYSLNRFFKFEVFGIALIDGKKLVLHPSFIGHSIKEVEKLELCLGKGVTGWVAEKGEPLLVNDVRNDPRYVVFDESIRSEVCVPLKVGQQVIGVIDAQSRALNTFSEDGLRLLKIAGGQIATVIENIRLRDEIKQSEERYRTVVESALDGVCAFGADYRLKFINRRFADILGFAREELINTDAREFLDEEGRKVVADREERRRRGITLSPSFESTIFGKGGRMRNVEISARTIKDSREDMSTIAILKDITEKKKMEEELFRAEKLSAIAEMASGVAHDFNNALAAILGNTQLLLYTAQDQETKETLRTIAKVAQDSAHTVRRLQDFTKKRGPQQLSSVDVNSVIKDSIEITKPKWKDEAQSKGVTIEIVSTFEEIPPVSGNDSEMRGVLTNMILNAIEAMPEGGKIEISTSKKRGGVIIQISDTGVGIAEEAKKKIFEPFYTTKPFTNTGLGLSMSYGIIKRFGGEIEVVSELGYGTTFTIILPFGEAVKDEGVSSQTIKKGRQARILVIDDEEVVRSVLSRTLANVNHQVTLAADGEKGVQLFQEGKYDMVLTDLGMPGMSGWEVCRMIKRISPDTPVGMITGWGADMSQSKMDEYGLDFLISKPFDLNQILNVVAKTMESKRG